LPIGIIAFPGAGIAANLCDKAGGAGELAALMTVEDLRPALAGKGFLQRLDAIAPS
jgi:hypothetical protein